MALGESAAPTQFRRYRSRAATLVRSPDEIRALAARATRKLAGSGGERVRAVAGELGALIALLKAYASGRYRRVSYRTLVAIAAAVLYFVVPLDAVPDFILALGFLDDAAVIGYVARLVHRDLEEFARWQREQDAGSA